MATPVAEPDLFAVPDTDFDVPMARTSPTHFADLSQIAEDHPELQDGLQTEEEFQPPVPASVETQPTVQPQATEQPEIIDIDGGTITIEKEKNGYKATLEQTEGGGKEVFRGRTRSDLMTEVLAAKLQATNQIRRLNKKLKIGSPVDAPAPVPTVVQKFEPRSLSADEVFEIKNALQADPDKAFELWFQKKFGLSAGELVNIAQTASADAKKGKEAHQELTIESVSKEFLERNKDSYYPYEENGSNVMGWLCKHKLRRAVTKQDDFGSISGELLEKGLYTVENLEEAVEDLKDSGLLILPPEPEQLQEEPPAPAPAPAPARAVASRQAQPAVPQNPRIVAQKRQPRGGLGLRPSVATSPTPEPDKAPSVDDLENASTEQINELFSAVRRHALQQPNRR